MDKGEWYYCPGGYEKSIYHLKDYLELCEKNYNSKMVKSALFVSATKPVPPIPKSNSKSPEVLAKRLPAIFETVKNPVTGSTGRLHDVIIQLNDDEMWTREQIADWIETLDIDIRF